MCTLLRYGLILARSWGQLDRVEPTHLRFSYHEELRLKQAAVFRVLQVIKFRSIRLAPYRGHSQLRKGTQQMH